jgi:hypothetical protein
MALSGRNTATQHEAHTRSLRRPVPGIGALLRLVLRDESPDIAPFPRGQDFASDGRLVTCAKASARKRDGTAGTTRGKADRTWACADAAVLFRRAKPAGQTYLGRLENNHGQGTALTVLAQTLARAVYSMWKRGVAFALHAWLQRAGRGVGAPAASRGHDGRAWPPGAARIHPVRRRTPMRPSARGPDPARLRGRLLPLREWERPSLRGRGCGPSPDPAPHGRLQRCRPACEEGGMRVQRRF